MTLAAAIRSRFRFSLKGMLLLILASGVWMGFAVNSARTQRRAVVAIREYGGFVHYDYEFMNGVIVPGREPRAPRWLRSRIGDDYFATVADVNLAFEGGGAKQRLTQRKDSSIMPVLRDLTGLRSLLIHEDQVTDESLAAIEGLSSLEELDIVRATRLTDAGLAHIARLGNLKKLAIHTGDDEQARTLTDAGLKNFAGLHHLKELDLWWPADSITDAGLAHIAGLTRLEKMTLANGTFTDAGLATLGRLVNLKELRLTFGTYRFTAPGMANLKPLKNLVALDLQGEKIPGEGLTHLSSLPNLKQLYLALGSPLFDHGPDMAEWVERLQQANPNIAVQ